MVIDEDGYYGLLWQNLFVFAFNGCTPSLRAPIPEPRNPVKIMMLIVQHVVWVCGRVRLNLNKPLCYRLRNWGIFHNDWYGMEVIMMMDNFLSSRMDSQGRKMQQGMVGLGEYP